MQVCRPLLGCRCVYHYSGEFVLTITRGQVCRPLLGCKCVDHYSGAGVSTITLVPRSRGRVNYRPAIYAQKWTRVTKLSTTCSNLFYFKVHSRILHHSRKMHSRILYYCRRMHSRILHYTAGRCTLISYTAAGGCTLASFATAR